MQIRGRTGFVFVFTMVIVAALIATALSLLLTPEQANGTAASNIVEIQDPYEPVSERAFAQPEVIQEETDLPPIEKDPPDYPNLDSNLNRLVEVAADAPRPANADGQGSDQVAEPVLVTFYIDPHRVADVREYLEENGVSIRHVGEDWMEAHVLPALLPAASERPGVRRVDTVILPEPQSSGNVVSQGVALHRADAWHRQGYRGQGVKVGVIDTGYQGFRQMQGGELPRNVTARCYFTGARTPSSRLADCEQAPCEEIACNHGTAVAETLVDVAPEVELYIANPMSQGDLRDAVDWMVEQGVQVINMSLGWIVDGPGDGTSPSDVSPLKTIDAAVSSGIIWVNAAGNSARNTWYGAFSDPDDDGWHNFTPQDVGNTFFLPYDETSPRRSTVIAFMRWDDSWGGADCDLDLHLVRSIPGPNNDVLIFSADVVQDGGADDDPFEVLGARATRISHEGTYYLVITKEDCHDEPAWIQLTTWMADDLEHYSAGHHIGNPGESRNPGMLAVAATHWWDTEYIADYSSRGPAIDGRTKPDITGVACARNATLGRRPGSACWFGGTSQASPHVAGLAALVKQRFPDYAPAQVADYLQQNADYRRPFGPDNIWGHGLATLPDPSTWDFPLGPPMNVRVNPVGNGLVNVAWDRVPGAAGYTLIAVSIANPAEARTKSVNNPDATAGQIGNLTIGAQYNIYVGSFDANLDFAVDFSEKRRVAVE